MSFRRSDRTGPAVIKKTPRRARLAPACLGDVQAPKERPRLINPAEEGAASAGGRPRFRAKAAEAPRVLEFIEHVLPVGTRPVGFLHLPAVEVPGPIDQGDRRRLFGLVPKVRAVRGRSHALQPPHEAHRPGGFPAGELDPGLGDQARAEGGRSRSVVFLEPAQGRTDGRGPARDDEALGASGLRLVPGLLASCPKPGTPRFGAIVRSSSHRCVSALACLHWVALTGLLARKRSTGQGACRRRRQAADDIGVDPACRGGATGPAVLVWVMGDEARGGRWRAGNEGAP